MSESVLFSGSAHPDLAAAIARQLSVPTGECEIERFPDGEVCVHINESVRNRDVFVVQPTAPPVNDNLVELVAFADAFRRAGACRIVAVVPYFGYARSDRRGERRDPIMAAAVADILQTAGIGHLITVDPHSAQLESCFRIPFDSISAVPVLAESVRGQISPDTVIVAPDVGAVRLATRYASVLGLPVVVLHKERESATQTLVTHIVGDVVGRPALLIDDMISTGGTIARSIDALLGAGAKHEVTVMATHGLLLPGARELIDMPCVREVVVTDSIPPQRWDKLRVISIAQLLASAIRRTGSFHRANVTEEFAFVGAC
ncbi:MAG TPA: ribose-phosphate pyrophosphokinase [Thermoanaerobaculia bacterium]|nr:ribose-phosphate pyrophosphokinase [Thermoanaerobaculia bacterium]